MTPRPDHDPRPPPGLRWRLVLAWAAILWERLWPALWPATAWCGLFLASALLGFWSLLPGLAHAVLLGLFWLTLAVLLARGVRRLPLPNREESLRRLERASGLRHRPLAALDDRPAANTDAAGDVLWRLHNARLRQSLRRLRIGLPRPGVAALDRLALRALVVLALAVGLMMAGNDAFNRLARALQPELGSPAPAASLDAWITPPAYTGLPPHFLTRAAEPSADPATALAVPSDSELQAQVHGGRGQADLLVDDTAHAFTELDDSNRQISLQLDSGSLIAVRQGSRRLAAWPIHVVPDQPPVIAFAEPAAATARHSLQIRYRATDDYGLAKVWLEIRHGADEKPLLIPLPLGGGSPGPGIDGATSGKQFSGTSYQDLTPHPWAGLPVTLTLIAEDGIGQRGESAPQALVLPARTFHNPVARALVEQRRLLAAGDARRALGALALSAVAELPEIYANDLGLYLGLIVSRQKLRNDPAPQAITAVQDLLWDAALRLEDGGLSLAERQLRDAQRALQDALERKAPDAEISQRLQALRDAVDRFLQAMQQHAPRNQAQAEMRQSGRSVSREDLQRMIDRAGDMAKSGARDAAQQMLDQLQAMLENLQSGQPNAGNSPGGAMDQLGQLLRRQQKLLDQTFRFSQRGNSGEALGNGPQAGGNRGFGADRPSRLPPGEQPGMNGGEPENGGDGAGMPGDSQAELDALAQQQNGLRQSLDELLNRLQRGGAGVPEALRGAGEAMNDAGDALRQEAPGEAVPPQTQAVQRLRDGAAALLQQLRQQRAGNPRSGTGGNGKEDPLGRPATDGWDTGDRVKIPDRSDVQQSREILEELYRRAGERDRPAIELDYLDRLLQRF